MMSQNHLRSDQAPELLHRERIAATKWFWRFLAFHLVLWTVVPTLVLANAPLDTIEMLYWGHEWQWGYYKHPPLAAWTAELSCVLLGNRDWPTYLASQLCTAAAFWAVFRLGLALVSPWQALAASLVLEASYYFNYETPQLNNNILSRLWWALAVLFLYWATTTGKLRHWAALGLCLGAALLSKYDVVFLIVAMLVYSVWDPQARSRWKTVGPLITLGISLIVAGPHLHWLVQHDFPTIRYALGRSAGGGGWFSHVSNPILFVVTQFAVIIPVVLLASPILCWREGIQQVDRSKGKFLLAIVVGPALCILLLSALTGARIRSMWGFPLWTFLPLAVIYFLPTRDAPRLYRRMVWRCVVVSLVFAAGFTVRNVASPYLRQTPSRVHFPGRDLAAAVEVAWKARQQGDIPMLAGKWWLAGNAAFYGSSRSSVYADLNPANGDWACDELLRERGGMIIWEPDDTVDTEKNLRQRFPTLQIVEPVELPWQTGAAIDPLKIHMAIVPGKSRR